MTDSVAKVIEEMREFGAYKPFNGYLVHEWADRLAALDGWRPISEAPRDADIIAGLYKRTYQSADSVEWECWSSRNFNMTAFEPYGRHWSSPSGAIPANNARAPTHWMPRPTPPKETP